jgi:hypothetical protein
MGTLQTSLSQQLEDYQWSMADSTLDIWRQYRGSTGSLSVGVPRPLINHRCSGTVAGQRADHAGPVSGTSNDTVYLEMPCFRMPES